MAGRKHLQFPIEIIQQIQNFILIHLIFFQCVQFRPVRHFRTHFSAGVVLNKDEKNKDTISASSSSSSDSDFSDSDSEIEGKVCF